MAQSKPTYTCPKCGGKLTFYHLVRYIECTQCGWVGEHLSECRAVEDGRAQQGIKHALGYLQQREDLYREWNYIHDTPEDSRITDTLKWAKLEAIERRTEAHERMAVVELHNLLFALGAVDKPMAS